MCFLFSVCFSSVCLHSLFVYLLFTFFLLLVFLASGQIRVVGLVKSENRLFDDVSKKEKKNQTDTHIYSLWL
jgi:hypothetical protein